MKFVIPLVATLMASTAAMAASPPDPMTVFAKDMNRLVSCEAVAAATARFNMIVSISVGLARPDDNQWKMVAAIFRGAVKNSAKLLESADEFFNGTLVPNGVKLGLDATKLKAEHEALLAQRDKIMTELVFSQAALQPEALAKLLPALLKQEQQCLSEMVGDDPVPPVANPPHGSAPATPPTANPAR